MADVEGEDAHALIERLPDGVVAVNAGGIVSHANAEARRLLGTGDPVGRPATEILSLSDLDGNTWFDVHRPYDGLAIRSAITEGSWVLPGGRELLVTARLVREVPAGPLSQLVVSLRSARVRERLDRERSDLVATVAHELRSPLTGVKGFVATLLSRWDRLNDEQKKLMLETVNADADRLTRLIAELLDVARIDTGRLSLHRQALDLGTVVTKSVESLRAGTSRVIALEVADNRPQVAADPDKVAQVVTNLVENGVRHGDGRVDVRVVAVDGGVAVVVDDEGDGIPEDYRARVFTKFWTRGSSGGSGLGMYIVHGLVTAHGGTIAIGDSPSGGARITTWWPAVELGTL